MTSVMTNNEIIERVLAKLDKLIEEMTELKEVSIKQEINLQNHMKRTELMEENMDILREEVKPLQKRFDAQNTIFKLIGIGASIITVGAGLIKIAEYGLTFLK